VWPDTDGRSVFSNRGTKMSGFEGKTDIATRRTMSVFESSAAWRASLRCRPINTRSYGLRFSVPARNRPLSSPCRDDSIGFGSLQLHIFQKLLRAADEFHVGARWKPKRDSNFLYERHAIVGIKIVRWLRVFPPTVRDSKHSSILFVGDWKRKMGLAHRDVIVWHRDDKTFYRLPSYGR